jgi:ABC-type nitrate/sulfonate/bicarbonate transport system substrate-binding protein
VLSSQFEAVLKSLLTKVGVNPDSNTYTIVSTSSTLVQTYNAGRADAAVLQLPGNSPLIDRASNEILESSYGLLGPSFNFFVSPKTLSGEPGVLKKFLTATYEGVAAENKNPAGAGAAVAAAVPELKASQMTTEVKLYQPFECSAAQSGHSLAYQPASDWTSMAQSLVAINAISSSLNISSLYTNEFESTGNAVQC